MTALSPNCKIVPSIATTSIVDLSVGNPQHDAPAGDNKNKSALPEMSGQMTLLKEKVKTKQDIVAMS